jgi:uracil-DNA glycosylase
MAGLDREDLRGELLAAVKSIKTRLHAVSGAERARGFSPPFFLQGPLTDPDNGPDGLSPSRRAPLETAPLDAQAAGQTLEEVKRDLDDCSRCSLCAGRKNIVFGEGDPHARLVFVGEAPGADEDVQGRPFVGRAGQLLTRIIEAMGLRRGDVYICNILKCRPPGNRNPEPGEIEACEPFLVKQLQAINPKMICALGTFAAHTLLKTEVPISLLRGRFHTYHGVKLMPTYHPAYLLRNPGAKKQVWEDVQMIMKSL